MKKVNYNSLNEDLKQVVQSKLEAVYCINSKSYDYSKIDEKYNFELYKGSVIMERIIEPTENPEEIPESFYNYNTEKINTDAQE